MAKQLTTNTKSEESKKFEVSENFPNSEFCDVAFVVEGKLFFLSKVVISVISPVFGAMFSSDFKEKECDMVPLPDKTAEGMEEFLGAIYPTVLRPLEDCDICRLLKLADEYQVDALKKRCAEHLTRKCKTKGGEIPVKDLLQMLLAADLYDLRELADVILPLTRRAFYSDVEKVSFFKDLSAEMKVEVMKIRLKTLEPMYHGGELSRHIRELVPCKSVHKIKANNYKRDCSEVEFNCEAEHKQRTYTALDFLLCQYLRCTSPDVSELVEWLKFAKETKCSKAVTMIQASENAPQFSKILERIQTLM